LRFTGSGDALSCARLLITEQTSETPTTTIESRIRVLSIAASLISESLKGDLLKFRFQPENGT